MDTKIVAAADQGLVKAFADTSPIYNHNDMQRYLGDWSGGCGGTPFAVVRPASTQEVSHLTAACQRAGKRITIQGGLTGLTGGAVPNSGDVVISLERMNRIEELDDRAGNVTVQAGVTLQDLCEAVEQRDWYFPLDFGARGSCQVGGNIATNAGGNRVLRYGAMRELVLGLEVVLHDGTVLPMLKKVTKNNTGLDLKHLFIGTEGTLGIITRAVLRLFPKPESRHTALCALSSFDHVAMLLKAARSTLPALSAFEVMWSDYLDAAAAILNRSAPFAVTHSLYVLLETEGSEWSGHAALETLLEQSFESGMINNAILPHTRDQAAALWTLRDAIGEILPSIQPYAAFDVGVPASTMDAFVQKVRCVLQTRFPDARHLCFGHLGDDNLHLASGPHSASDLRLVEELVYSAVSEVGGSISGEHGIGRIKKPFLPCSRSSAEIATMRTIKQALDGANLLNAGRIFD